MADTIVRVVDGGTRVIIDGGSLLSTLAAQAQGAADSADASATAAAASEAAAAAAAATTEPLAINRRVHNFMQTGIFTTGEVTGPYRTDTDELLTNNPIWSIDSAGALVVSGTWASPTARHRSWDAGHTWKGNDVLEAIIENVWTELPVTLGPTIRLGSSPTPVHFFYGRNGRLGCYNSDGTEFAGKGTAPTTYANIAFVVGQTARLRVVVYPDGTGFLEGTNVTTGEVATHPLANITERGTVQPSARQVGATISAAHKITYFTARAVDSRVIDVTALEATAADLENRVDTMEAGGASVLKPLSVALLTTSTLNHIALYGQSNSIGYDAIPPISTAQPYSNVTFNNGPRQTTSSLRTPLKPLIEVLESTVLGETPCSGAANYASTMMARRGVDPASHVILASASGAASTAIANLKKGSSQYNNVFLPQIVAAKALDANYVCQAVGWVQGEEDAKTTVATPYATYKADLLQLQADIETDIKAASGQTTPAYLLVTQITMYATANDKTARAQFDASRESDRIFVTCPSYRVPYVNGIHFSNVGARLAGAYMGRAYDQMLQGYEPDQLTPIAATVEDDIVTVHFDVPHLPLRLDTTDLATVANYGFQVRDAGTPATISSVALSGAKVVITLAAPPSGAVTVRYALDATGAGRPSTEGGGNLRDSAPETATISGTSYQLFNAAPAFELAAIRIEG